MKKAFLMAAAAAMIFASCSQEPTTPAVETKGNIVIKLNGVNTPATRAIDNPENGNTDKITLTNGWVFVFNSSNALLHQEKLVLENDFGDVTDQEGQLLKDNGVAIEAAGTEKIYIIGNLPETSGDGGATEAERLTEINDATAILAEASKWVLIELQGNDKFNAIPVANSTGALASLTKSPSDLDGDATNVDFVATISLSPLMSRVELMSIQAETEAEAEAAGQEDKLGTIISFKVGGVYVDSYYPSFIYGGTQTGTNALNLTSPASDNAPWYGGETFEQKQVPDFTANVARIGGDTYTVADYLESDGTGDDEDNRFTVTTGVAADSNPANANPEKVWAYNVPSKGVARLIVFLPEVKYVRNGGVATNPDDVKTLTDKYLTVGRYLDGSSTPIDNMARGYIYRIGDTTAGNDFVFGADDLDDDPNPIKGSMSVIVTVKDWIVETPNAELM